MAGKKTNGARRFSTCTLYKFKGKAPVMAEVLSLIGEDFKTIQGKGGPHSSTMRDWKPAGKTRCAHFLTMQNALMAAGYEFEIRKRVQ